MTIQRRKVLSRSKKLNDREIHDMREIVEMAKDELTQKGIKPTVPLVSKLTGYLKHTLYNHKVLDEYVNHYSRSPTKFNYKTLADRLMPSAPEEARIAFAEFIKDYSQEEIDALHDMANDLSSEEIQSTFKATVEPRVDAIEAPAAASSADILKRVVLACLSAEGSPTDIVETEILSTGSLEEVMDICGESIADFQSSLSAEFVTPMPVQKPIALIEPKTSILQYDFPLSKGASIHITHESNLNVDDLEAAIEYIDLIKRRFQRRVDNFHK